METQLQVPYRDTAADDLVWRLGEPRRPALAILELEVAGAGRLELRLLGSSHQVLLTGPGTVISEVVACEPTAFEEASERGMSRPRPENDPGARHDAVGSAAARLPSVAQRELEGWEYRFRSRTSGLAPVRLERRVERLVGRLADHPAAIVGRFPGSPHAITALLAGPGPGGAGLRWRTWHAYPQDGCLVATSTTVSPR